VTLHLLQSAQLKGVHCERSGQTDCSTWPLSVLRHNNNKKLFQLAFLCLLVVLVLEFIIRDSEFTNDDPPFHVSQPWIVVTSLLIAARLIKCSLETVYLSIVKFKSISRSPPA
jgi:hypothetical protein